MSESAKQ